MFEHRHGVVAERRNDERDDGETRQQPYNQRLEFDDERQSCGHGRHRDDGHAGVDVSNGASHQGRNRLEGAAMADEEVGIRRRRARHLLFCQEQVARMRIAIGTIKERVGDHAEDFDLLPIIDRQLLSDRRFVSEQVGGELLVDHRAARAAAPFVRRQLAAGRRSQSKHA
jgi:hypothetical protein